MDNLCIGTAQFGMDYGIANKAGRPSKKEVRRIIEAASENGIFFYDTAAAYGDSETMLGEIFRELNIQEKVKVITKLPPDFHFRDITDLKGALQLSLNRLQLDSLWGVMLHRPQLKGKRQDFQKAVSSLKEKGVLAHFGISLYHPDDALKSVQDPMIEIIQAPFNLMDRRLLDNGFFEQAGSAHKTIFIRSLFLQGLLLMKENDIKAKGMRWAMPFLHDLHRFHKNLGIDAKAFITGVVCQSFPWLKVVIGVDSHRQLLENISLLKSEALPGTIIQKWWSDLPCYPEKLVNPALWHTA